MNKQPLASEDIDIDEIDKQSRIFICPCCNTELQFKTKVQIYRVQLAEKSTPSQEEMKALAPRSAEDILLDQFQAQGILDPFIEACEWITSSQRPKNLRRYFLTFLGAARRREYNTRKPSAIMSAYHRKLRDLVPDAIGDIEAYTFSAITLLVVDGKYRRFVPTDVIRDLAVTKLSVTDGQIRASHMSAIEWRKTKYGYVANDVFWNALQVESQGSYGRATKTQR